MCGRPHPLGQTKPWSMSPILYTAVKRHAGKRDRLRASMAVPQRPFWTGQPLKGKDVFTLRSHEGNRLRVAVCEVWTHYFGWELRLCIDREPRRSRVCYDSEQLGETARLWCATLAARGWR